MGRDRLKVYAVGCIVDVIVSSIRDNIARLIALKQVRRPYSCAPVCLQSQFGAVSLKRWRGGQRRCRKEQERRRLPALHVNWLTLSAKIPVQLCYVVSNLPIYCSVFILW